MAIKVIPLDFNSPDFTFQVELDGTVFGFRFTLNERANRFTMEIQTELGEAIISGVAVVSDWKLLERFKDTRLPKGKLFTCETTGSEAEPDQDTFGDTVLLCYAEEGTVL